MPTVSDVSVIIDGERVGSPTTFGVDNPALPVIPDRDLDDGVARANATTFGLSGSAWSADPDRAVAVAEQLEVGTAWVDSHLALAPHQPFGGCKVQYRAR